MYRRESTLSEWVKACNLNQLKNGQMLGFSHGDDRILLVNIGGQIYAADSTCTHADADLSTGFLSEEGVRCPLHLSVFDMKSGKPQNLPAETPLNTYNVKIDDDVVYVEV